MHAKRPVRLLCLDFDGVICDSANECMLVTYDAYFDVDHVHTEALPTAYCEVFKRYRYLVRDPGEYYLLANAYDEGRTIDEARFTAVVAGASSACREFKQKFFAARRALRRKDERAWVNLHSAYEHVVEFMKTATAPIDIITTKDEESVDALLTAYGVREKVGRIFGQQALTAHGGKAGAIRVAVARRGLEPSEVAYLDDHLKHLADVRDTGVHLWHATWGYTDPEVQETPAYVRALAMNRVHAMLEAG